MIEAEEQAFIEMGNRDLGSASVGAHAAGFWRRAPHVLLYTGIDVSLAMTSICVVDADGRIILETKVASDPEVLTCCLGELPGCFERVGLEAGRSSALHKVNPFSSQFP